jgi:hypothetical protein
VPKVSFHDENALEPNTQYEYCVSAGNEFGEACGPIVTVRSGKRLADPLAAYETAAKPDDVAAARAIWLRLAASKLGIPLDPAGPVPVEPGLATTRRLVAGAPFPASPAAADGEAGNGGFWRGTALVPKPGSTDTGLAG